MYSFSCFDDDRLVLEIKFNSSSKDVIKDFIDSFIQIHEPEPDENSISLAGQHAEPVLTFDDSNIEWYHSDLNNLPPEEEVKEVKKEEKVSKCPVCSLTTKLLGDSTCYDSHCPMPNRVNSRR